MFDLIRSLLSAKREEGAAAFDRVAVATAVLMIELALADEDLAEVEERLMHDLLGGQFGINQELTAELIAYAQEAHQKSTGLYRFTAQINDSFSRTEKMEVIRNLWRLVFADGVVDRYEEAVMREVAALLRFHPHELIEAKLAIAKEQNGHG